MPRTLASAAALIVAATVSAQVPAVSTSPEEPPPAELAGPVRALLAPGRTTVTASERTLELWWVKAVALSEEGSGAAAWSMVPQGSLVGALRLTSDTPDVRGFTIRPGVYTLRVALQPQNGDHLGISPYREFLLVAPAADDTTPDPLGYEAAVKLAAKAARRAHPASLSLDPPEASGEPLAIVPNEFGQSVLFRVPAARGGTEAGTLTFGLMVEGRIEH